ncbi:MAG TPA: Gfo/Idh/MocA family oxidoreductase, partial [Planctomycetota bacterium]|nr:Gfo/Idh/MocA family oxidoreductase [Planctomycetota bacterium]
MKAIVVGLGGRGRHWVRVCRDFGSVELVAFVEPAANIKKLAVTELGIAENAIYGSLTEAIKAHKADFVIDVTPPAVHEAVALSAFENGLHVLGEKPISSSVAAARRMIEASKRAGRRHMITQNYRFGAVPRTTRRLVKEGIVGKPGQLDVTFYMPWADLAGSHYVTEPYMFLNDMCIHHFDMMRSILVLLSLILASSAFAAAQAPKAEPKAEFPQKVLEEAGFTFNGDIVKALQGTVAKAGKA